MTETAILVLEDGTVFEGESVGAPGLSVGEVVFNTAITGYQEVLSDPSYARQLVTLTYPHIGNTGCTDLDDEAGQVWASGLIVRNVPRRPSNWRSQIALPEWLKARGIVAISEIDTRKLTRLLRDRGAQNGALMAGDIDVDKALEAARKFPGLKGMDLAKVVSTGNAYPWTEGQLDLDRNAFVTAEPKYKVVAYDFGVKRNILRMLAERGCDVTVVPAQTPAADVLAMNPDGVFLSNGPGDPAPCDYAIAAIREFIARKVPTFGICLGHQLLGLASGAQTLKMKFGHHGANHPVIDIDSGRVMITSQNHGFAIDESHAAGQRPRDPSLAVRRQQPGHRPDRHAGLQLPGPSGSQPRSARCVSAVRPVRGDDAGARLIRAPHAVRGMRHPPISRGFR